MRVDIVLKLSAQYQQCMQTALAGLGNGIFVRATSTGVKTVASND